MRCPLRLSTLLLVDHRLKYTGVSCNSLLSGSSPFSLFHSLSFYLSLTLTHARTQTNKYTRTLFYLLVCCVAGVLARSWRIGHSSQERGLASTVRKKATQGPFPMAPFRKVAECRASRAPAASEASRVTKELPSASFVVASQKAGMGSRRGSSSIVRPPSRFA